MLPARGGRRQVLVEEHAITDELSSLPDLSETYRLTPDQVAAYRRDGHVLLRGVASPSEIAAYRPLVRACVLKSDKHKVPLSERDTYHRAFLQLANLWETDDRIARFTLARRFACIAAELMGVTGVRLYHDQALFKEAGGGSTPWHQDQYYWPLDTPHTITMWMPLVNVSVEMGPLTFASGSHAQGLLCPLAISDESNSRIEEIIRQRRFPVVRAAMSCGDATFHSGWTLHSAPGNHTDTLREVMTVIYYADGTRLLEPDNPHRPADLARWFPGRRPGEIAASPLNPLLFHDSMIPRK